MKQAHGRIREANITAGTKPGNDILTSVGAMFRNHASQG